MKIGVFDSGLGGLVVLRGLVKMLPAYDYLYLGDTKRVPYGNRSEDTIYEFLKEGVEYLLGRDCALVVVACNTASATALRRIQQEYLPKKYPDRRVLGVIIPTSEVAVGSTTTGRIGVLATQGTVNSGAYKRELGKLNPEIEVFQSSAPLLVPLIEGGMNGFSAPFIEEYLKPLRAAEIDTLILGCTHYPILKDEIAQSIGKGVKIISQDDILPIKLGDYILRHPEISERLSENGSIELAVTDITQTSDILAKQWFGDEAKLTFVEL